MRIAAWGTIVLATVCGCSKPSADSPVVQPAGYALPAPAPSTLTSEESTALAQLSPSNSQLEGAVSVLEGTRNADVREEASARLVTIARYVASARWRDDNLPKLEHADTLAGFAPTPEQLDEQIHDFQTESLLRVLRLLGRIGGRSAYGYLVELAGSADAPPRWRHAALDALAPYAAADAQLMNWTTTVRASLPPPPPPVPKPRAQTQAEAVAAAMRPDLRRCFEAELARDPNVQGSGTMTLKVGADGAVVAAKVTSNLPATLSDCVRVVGERARFAPPIGGSAVVSVPITFVPK